MSRELQPPVLSESLVKIQLPTVIKNELPESEIVEIGIDDILDSSESEEEIISDVKDIDIVYHPVCDESIKSEILESKHCESVETQVSVKAENFVKTENITQRNKNEDTSDENVTKGSGQAVVEIQASNEHSNALSKLETDEQSVLNFSKNLKGSVRSRKSKSPKKTDFAECYKTDATTLWEKEKEKIKVIIKAPVIPVEAHEYTSLAKDKHVCNHCQQTYKKWESLKVHIRRKHREVATIYQCPYCPHKSKWSVKKHIILKHKDTKDIQWFQHDCNKCGYKTCRVDALKRHYLIHLKPEEIEYFYCYHCSYKCQRKDKLKIHIFLYHFKNAKQGKRHHCDKCDYETYTSTKLKNHKLSHLKPEEIQYLYCYHCSYKGKWKGALKKHIFTHFKKEQVKFYCYVCNFVTPKRESIIKHIKKHSKVQNKS